MQETRNNCLGSKILSMTHRLVKTSKHDCWNITATLLLYFLVCYVCTNYNSNVHNIPKYNSNVAVIFLPSCSPVFIWWKVVVHIFDPKQLLRVSCTSWCYYWKCFSIILENARLRYFIVYSMWIPILVKSYLWKYS